MTYLEPLDKGRLSLGDVGDAFRAKRGKNAGFPHIMIYSKCYFLFSLFSSVFLETRSVYLSFCKDAKRITLSI